MNVRVCQCCVAQLGKTAMDRIVLLRKNASVEDVRRVEDEYLAQLNAMPARRRVWRMYPKTEVA